MSDTQVSRTEEIDSGDAGEGMGTTSEPIELTNEMRQKIRETPEWQQVNAKLTGPDGVFHFDPANPPTEDELAIWSAGVEVQQAVDGTEAGETARPAQGKDADP